MSETAAPHAARVSAAQALLDRGWGKATQIMELEGKLEIAAIEWRVVDPKS